MSIIRFPALIWLGAGVMIISLGTRQTFGLLMAPISEHFQVGRELFSLAIALQNLLFGLFQPFVGAAADRFGAKPVIMAGGLIYAMGLWLTSLVVTPGMLYLSLGMLIGLGLSATSYVIVLGAVARAVPPRHTAKAFGLTTAAGSFGMFAFIPATQPLLQQFGWQQTLQLFALLFTLVIAFAAFMRGANHPRGTTAPKEHQASRQTLPQALAEAFRHPGYLLIHGGFFVCGFHVMFIATHLPAYLADLEFSANSAAMALAYVGIFNIFGSFFWGMMGDRFNKRHVMTCLYLLRALVLWLFMVLPTTDLSACLFGAAMGFCWLGTVPLTSGLVRQIFGPRYLSTLYGLVFLTHQVGSFLGAWIGGRLYDMIGSYEPLWWATIAMAVIAGLLHLPINDRPLQRAQVPAYA